MPVPSINSFNLSITVCSNSYKESPAQIPKVVSDNVTWTQVSGVTIPLHLPKQFTFTPSSLQVYDSDVLGITCDTCELAILPDGIYKVKYTMTPAYQYFIEKSFLRTNQIYAKLDKLFLHLEFMQCDLAIKEEEKRMLDSIEFFIEGAKAAAHNCLEKEVLKLYKQANKMIEDYEKRCKNKKLSA